MTTETTRPRSAHAEVDMMAAPALAIVNQIRNTATAGIDYTDVRLYAGPESPEADYYGYPMRLRWFLTPEEAAKMARVLRQTADAIEARAEARIEAEA